MEAKRTRMTRDVSGHDWNACCGAVVIRRLARVGNGWGCDERRNEFVNESVVVGDVVKRVGEMR